MPKRFGGSGGSGGALGTLFIMLLLIMVLGLKLIIVSQLRGDTLTPREVLSLAFVDVCVMFLLAWVLTKAHAIAASTAS